MPHAAFESDRSGTRGAPSAAVRELAEEIRRRVPGPGRVRLAASGVGLVLRDGTNATGDCVVRPSFAVIAGGEKRADLMGRAYRYAAGSCLFVGVDVTDSFRVVGASSAAPFLCASLDFEEDVMAAALSRLRDATTRLPAAAAAAAVPAGPQSAVSVFAAPDEVVGVFLRLIRLEDEGGASALLAPLLKEELYFRLLTGPMGPVFRRFFHAGSSEGRIREAAAWMRRSFRENFDVDAAARRVGMSSATFYRRFRDVVGESPRQYVKKLRLFEAKRLLVDEGFDAAGAAYEVGYESPAHFSREFKRLFGRPPRQFAEAARSAAEGAEAA